MQDYKSKFENINDEEFENLLKEININYTKVAPEKGGIIYEGKLYKSYEEYEKAVEKDRQYV